MYRNGVPIQSVSWGATTRPAPSSATCSHAIGALRQPRLTTLLDVHGYLEVILVTPYFPFVRSAFAFPKPLCQEISTNGDTTVVFSSFLAKLSLSLRKKNRLKRRCCFQIMLHYTLTTRGIAQLRTQGRGDIRVTAVCLPPPGLNRYLFIDLSAREEEHLDKLQPKYRRDGKATFLELAMKGRRRDGGEGGGTGKTVKGRQRPGQREGGKEKMRRNTKEEDSNSPSVSDEAACVAKLRQQFLHV